MSLLEKLRLFTKFIVGHSGPQTMVHVLLVVRGLPSVPVLLLGGSAASFYNMAMAGLTNSILKMIISGAYIRNRGSLSKAGLRGRGSTGNAA